MHSLNEEDYNQVKAWMAYLEYEKTNPMQRSEEEFHHWMKQSYERALGCCQYCPDLWLSYIEYANHIGHDFVLSVLEKAKNALSDSMFFRIRICEFFESINEIPKADSEYRRLVNDCNNPTPWIIYQQFTLRNFGISASREVFQRARLSCKAPELYIAAGCCLQVG